MSTHLDDQGSRSRLEAAHIILRKTNEYLTGEFGKYISGIFLAGDFNSQENQEAYSVLTGAESPLADTANLVNLEEHYGNNNTATGFGYEGQEPSRIDYILLGPGADKDLSLRKQPWEVEGYAVLANRFDDGVFNSDHRAVVADVILYN